MLNFGELHLWWQYLNGEDKLKYKDVSTVSPQTMIESCACFVTEIHIQTPHPFQVVIRKTDETPCMFYHFTQYAPYGDAVYPQRLGSIEYNARDDKIWVRWHYGQNILRQFSRNELFTFLDLLENATMQFDKTTLLDFDKKKYRSAFYKR